MFLSGKGRSNSGCRKLAGKIGRRIVGWRSRKRGVKDAKNENVENDGEEDED